MHAAKQAGHASTVEQCCSIDATAVIPQKSTPSDRLEPCLPCQQLQLLSTPESFATEHGKDGHRVNTTLVATKRARGARLQ
eukprot:569661-Alexandrium_andersonii.AAC.1